MSSKNLLVGTSLVIGVGFLGFDLYKRVGPSIQSGIQNDVAALLPNGTRHKAKIVVSGRDIEVSGKIHDENELSALETALKEIEGTRIIHFSDIEFLPVAKPYSAQIYVGEDGKIIETTFPDEIVASQISTTLNADTTLDYKLASGMPNSAWPDTLLELNQLANQLEIGEISMNDTQISILGETVSVASKTDFLEFQENMPADYTLNLDGLKVPPPFSITLSKSKEGQIEISGASPKTSTIVELEEVITSSLGNRVSASSDLNNNADGDIQSIQSRISKLTPILNDLKAFELLVVQDEKSTVQLTGQVEPNVDLDAFDKKRSELGLQNADLEMPRQFDVAFTVDAETGAELTGLAPEGFDPEEIASNLGLQSINTENFEIGARGDSSALSDQISNLKPVLQDVETITLGLAGKEGEEVPEAKIEAETLPNVDPSRVSALLVNLFANLKKPEVAKTTKVYKNGQTRINGISGIREVHQNGFWLPLVSVTNASPETCRKVTDSILKNQQIEFASGLAELEPTSRVIINRLAGVVSSCFEQTALNVQLAGHTDNQGDPNNNLRLSILRVNSVRDALVNRGITFSRILTIGYGETRPLYDNSTKEGRKKNRRTEFEWIN